jgi:PadR family transcriptional regulator, regulatory protein PadR
MSTGPAENRAAPNRIDLLQGTLDMLILRTLLFAPAHGHTIAHAIEHGSEEVLQVEHGSLYPALHRLVRQGWLSAKEGLSDNNRKAKYYSLTAKGRKRLIAESSKWDRLSQAIGRIMRPVGEEGHS